MYFDHNIKELLSEKGITSSGSKLFKIPEKKIYIQSRNINRIDEENVLNKNSLYSTSELTPRKEQQKNSKMKNYDLDDSLSQISLILNNKKKDMNYSGLVGKFPGIYEEPNFIYDQILYNKKKLNKVKNISRKIKVLKIPISNITSKEILYNSNSERFNKCLSDRMNDINKKNKDIADATCCFF